MENQVNLNLERGKILKKNLTILLCAIFLFSLTACSSIENNTLQPDQELLKLETARNEVVEKFKHERDVKGTSKIIEDRYKEFPDDEMIATIYNYDNAKFCYDVYIDLRNEPIEGMDEKRWLEKAKSYASKISPDYDGAFKEEILPFVSELLGDEWEALRQQALEAKEKLNKLTLEDKKEIVRFIQDRYDYYDSQKGYSGDRYTEIIWKETSEKFDLPTSVISAIWADTEVFREIGKDEEQKQEYIKYDAILNFNNGDSIIAVDEKSLDRFMSALANNDEGIIEELFQKQKVAKVPSGTKVNIIEKKATRAKVKILSGLYKDNKVWVLIESVQQ